MFCCPSAKSIPKCGWFDFNNGKCGKVGTCPTGSEEIVGPMDLQREVGSTQAACNNGKAQVACCQTADESGKALDSMLGYDSCKWFGTAPDKCDHLHTSWGTACSADGSARTDDLFMSVWGSGATRCNNPDYGDEMARPLCCKPAAFGAFWNYCSVVSAERRDGNFCQAHCPAGTIRMGMEKPDDGEGCKGGANAVCCEPRFFTQANNNAEVLEGFAVAVGAVVQDPEQCSWDDVASGDTLSIKRRDKADSSYCMVALAGLMVMLGSVDFGMRQKYSNAWDAAVERVNMNYIPASTMISVPDGFAFSTAPSAPIKTLTAIAILNSAKDINSKKKTPAKRKWTCPSDWIWDSGLNGNNVDPDDGGEEEILAESLWQLSLNPLGRRDDLGSGPDMHLPVSPVRHGAAPPDSPDSESDPKFVDWVEALERLRRFHLPDKDKTADTPNVKKPKATTFRRRHDAESCEKNVRCRARMLGFDLSQREDRMAYFNATLAEAQGKPKRYAEEFERRNRLKTETGLGSLDERQSGQKGQRRTYVIRSSSSQYSGDLIESGLYPNGNQGDDLIALNDDRSRYVVKSTGCGPQDYILKTDAAKSEVSDHGIWVTEHILEMNTIGRFMLASLEGGVPGAGLGRPPRFFSVGRAKINEVEMFAHPFPEWDKYSALTAADTCLLQLGSDQNHQGLVVCDSNLNLVKTKIYKVQDPMSERTWSSYCVSALPANLEHAFSYIQTIMAVFDYYDDPNVKKRHAGAYWDVMNELIAFEQSYDAQHGTNIYNDWQQRWYEFMTAHFDRVLENAHRWLKSKLEALKEIWAEAVQNCGGSTSDYCGYCLAAEWLINSYLQSLDSKIFFDASIFEWEEFS